MPGIGAFGAGVRAASALCDGAMPALESFFPVSISN